MTDAEKFKVYSTLRNVRRKLWEFDTEPGTAEDAALNAVNYVLYLAIDVFAKMSD